MKSASVATRGERFRDARRRVRLSQTAVAGYAGTTRQTIAAFEKGEREPNLGQLVGLANLYRLSLDELVSPRPLPNAIEAVPAFRARTNRFRALTEHDRDELRRFDDYLRGRHRSAPRVVLQRGPFEALDDTIRRLIDAVSFEFSFPVPVFGLLSKCGIEVRFTAMNELAGALLLADDNEKVIAQDRICVWPRGTSRI